MKPSILYVLMISGSIAIATGLDVFQLAAPVLNEVCWMISSFIILNAAKQLHWSELHIACIWGVIGLTTSNLFALCFVEHYYNYEKLYMISTLVMSGVVACTYYLLHKK